MTPTQKALDALGALQRGRIEDSGARTSLYNMVRTFINQSDPAKIREAALDEVEREVEKMRHDYIESGPYNTSDIDDALSRIRSLRDQGAEPTSICDLPDDIVYKLDHAIEQSDKNAKDPEWVNRMAKDIADTPSDYAPEKVKGDHLFIAHSIYADTCTRCGFGVNHPKHIQPEKVKGGEGESDDECPKCQHRNMGVTLTGSASNGLSRSVCFTCGFCGYQWVIYARYLFAERDAAPSQPDSEGTRESPLSLTIEQMGQVRTATIRECVEVVNQYQHNEFYPVANSTEIGVCHEIERRLTALLDKPEPEPEPELTWDDAKVRDTFRARHNTGSEHSFFKYHDEGAVRIGYPHQGHKTYPEHLFNGRAWTILSIDQAEGGG